MFSKKDVVTELSGSQRVSKTEQTVPSELKLTLTFVDKSPNRQNLPLYSVFTSRLQEAAFEDGLVGESFERFVDFRDALRAGRQDLYVRIDESSGFDAFGLRSRIDDSGRLVIFGKPQFAFKANVVITGRRAVFSQNKEECVDIFKVEPVLCVGSSPAPQSLWENHEPPKDAPYQTPNEQKESLIIPLETPITVLAASRRGRSHEHIGAFRDDYFTLKPASESSGWHVFAVADGAGSARFSRKGARLVCETLTEEIAAFLNESQTGSEISRFLESEIRRSHREGALATEYLQNDSILKESKLLAVFYQAIRNAYEAIRQEALRYNAEHNALDSKVAMRDFSTTALCLAIKRFQGENGFPDDDKKYCPPIWAIVSYWIGDGALVVYQPSNTGYSSLNVCSNEKDKALLLGNPDGGEFAGQTQFLTTKEEIDPEPVLRRMRLSFVRKFRGIVMATDGISDPFFPSDSSLKKFESWRQFWKKTLPEKFPGILDNQKTNDKRAEALLKGMEFWVKGNHDDRTMVLILNDRLEGMV